MKRSLLCACLALPLFACSGEDADSEAPDGPSTRPGVGTRGGLGGSSLGGMGGTSGSASASGTGKGGAPLIDGHATGTCSHSVCQVGAPLVAAPKACSSCVARVCTLDPYCCSTAWDVLCVKATRTQCGACL